MEHPLSEELLPQKVRETTSPLLPKNRRLAVAAGLVPMTPDDNVLALYQLAFDGDKEVSSKAVETLKTTPVAIVVAAVKKFSRPEPLDYIARAYVSKSEVIQALLVNPDTDNATIGDIARVCSRDVADIIAGNQARLMAYPKIIESLYLNRNTRMSTVDRIVSFAVRNNVELEGLSSFKEIVASYTMKEKGEEAGGAPAADFQPRTEHAADAIFETAFFSGFDRAAEGDQVMSMGDGAGMFGEFDGDGHSSAGVFGEFDEAAGGAEGGDLFGEFDDTLEKQRKEKEEEKDESKLPLEMQISHMPIAHKIRLAMIGTAVHRAILLQDSNKLVAIAAIKSPAINEQEVVRCSQSRSVSIDVIRHIAENKNWTKNRFIKVNLINNPKTPLPSSLSFLHSMNKNELKIVASNKNIPTALRTAAANIVKRAEGGGKH
jgi:hypothetical protein